MAAFGVTLDSAARILDVIVHDTRRNWLLLIEAVTSAGPVDGKRRKELKDLFAGCQAGLVFVTAFENRRAITISADQALAGRTLSRPLRLLDLTSNWLLHNHTSASPPAGRKCRCRNWPKPST